MVVFIQDFLFVLCSNSRELFEQKKFSIWLLIGFLENGCYSSPDFVFSGKPIIHQFIFSRIEICDYLTMNVSKNSISKIWKVIPKIIIPYLRDFKYYVFGDF